MKVLITSIPGRDSSYLGDFLLTQGDRVVGMVQRACTENFDFEAGTLKLVRRHRFPKCATSPLMD